jgi:hypothetical protein
VFSPPGGAAAVRAAPGYPTLGVVVTSIDTGPSDGALTLGALLVPSTAVIEWGSTFGMTLVGGTWSPAPANVTFFDSARFLPTQPCQVFVSDSTTASCVVASVLDSKVAPTSFQLRLQWAGRPTVNLPVGALNVTFATPRLTFVTDPDVVLSPDGGDVVTVRLPQLPPVGCAPPTGLFMSNAASAVSLRRDGVCALVTPGNSGAS